MPPEPSSAASLDQIKDTFGLLNADVPVLLLPVRLETRFFLQEPTPVLRLRVYPDPIHTDDHIRGLTGRETALGRAFWAAMTLAAQQGDDQRPLWDRLVERLGARRAAWVARQTNPAEGDANPPAAIPRPPLTAVLPQRWVVLGYLHGARVLEAAGEIIPPLLSLRPSPAEDPADAAHPDLPIDEAGAWLIDFQQAVAKGMALEIPLTGALASVAQEGLDELFMLGVKPLLPPAASAALIDELLTGHYYTGGLDFVPAGTPTNSTESQGSGWSATPDAEAYWQRDVLGSLPAPGETAYGPQAALVLGLDETSAVRTLPGAEVDDEDVMRAMNTALWPITWGEYLSELLEGDTTDLLTTAQIATARTWWVEQVRGGPPLPTLRVGDVPYGILPVQLAPALPTAPQSMREALAGVLHTLLDTWNESLPDVPRMNPVLIRRDGQAVETLPTETVEANVVTLLSSQPHLWRGFLVRFLEDRKYPHGWWGFASYTSLWNTALDQLRGLMRDDVRFLFDQGLEQAEDLEAQIALFELFLDTVYPTTPDDDPAVVWLNFLLDRVHNLQDRIAPLRDIPGLSLTGLYGAPEEPVIFYSSYRSDADTWLEDYPLAGDADQFTAYMDWLDEYAGAVNAGTAEGMTPPDLGSPPPLMFHLFKQAIDRAAAQQQGTSLFMGTLAGRLAGASLQPAQVDQLIAVTERIEGQSVAALRKTAASIQQVVVRGQPPRSADEVALRRGFERVPVEAVRQMARAIEAAGRIPTRPPAARDALSTLSETLDRSADRLASQDRPAPNLADALHEWQRVPEIEHLPLDNFLPKVRTALDDLRAYPLEVLERVLLETLSLASYRLDAWATSLALDTLKRLRSADGGRAGIQIGGFGWVEDLRPAADPVSQGFIHAPSMGQAATAAVLRSGWQAYGTQDAASPLAVNLTSDRVRQSAWLLDGVRQGQMLGDLLGARFERLLHDSFHDRFIAPCRRAVLDVQGQPDTPANLPVDGLALLDAWHAGSLNTQLQAQDPPQDVAGFKDALETLDTDLDGLADTTLAESVHQLVQGNLLRAGATLDAITLGDAAPPELFHARTPRAGIGLTHRVCLLLPAAPAGPAWPGAASSPRSLAAPALEGWIARLLDVSPTEIACRVAHLDPAGAALDSRPVTLHDLGLSALDAILSGPVHERTTRSEWEIRARLAARRLWPNAAQVTVDFEDPAGGRMSFADCAVLARELRRVLARGRALDARDLASSSESVGSGVDAAELEARAEAVEATLGTAIAALRNALSGADNDALVAALLDALRLEPVAVPGLAAITDDVSALTDAATRLLARLQARQAALNPKPNEKAAVTGAPLDDDARVAQAAERIRRVLGKAFPVLPVFLPADEASLRAAFTPQAGWPTSAEVMGWLSQVAHVRQDVRVFYDALSTAELLTGQRPIPRAGQFPVEPGAPWVGLHRPASRQAWLSLLAFPLPGADLPQGQPLAGLVLDQWSEVVPASKQTTGLTFHFDAPGARAPQTLLLAVPPDGGGWSFETLAATLRQTLEWARLRSVSTETLAGYGQHIPAIFNKQSPLSGLPDEDGT